MVNEAMLVCIGCDSDTGDVIKPSSLYRVSCTVDGPMRHMMSSSQPPSSQPTLGI